MRKPSFMTRLRIAWAAFKAAGRSCAYAVIYDSYEGLDPEIEGPREEYYEVFATPAEANEFFRSAFPHSADVTENERLVLILGSIDNYKEAA